MAKYIDQQRNGPK